MKLSTVCDLTPSSCICLCYKCGLTQFTNLVFDHRISDGVSSSFLLLRKPLSQEFVSADEVDSGLCSECVSPILTLIFVQVPHRLSPSICSTQHSDPYPWPGPVHRMPRLLLTCAVGNRFCLQCGTAIVSWSPELLYLGTESLLTPKCGTISHLSLPLRDLHVATQVCLLDTQTLSTFLSSLFFFPHGFFPKLP